MKLVRQSFTPVRPLAVFLATALFLSVSAAPGRAAAAPTGPAPETLDLRSAIAFALENNFAIRQAKERIRQQEGVVLEVRARQIPNVGAAGTYQLNEKEISSYIPAADRSWQISVTATQVLFAGGGVRSAVRGSNLAREAAVLDLQATINDALLQVRTAFYGVLLAREKIKVQESNLELLQSQLRTATDRYRAGTVSSFEQLRAEVAVANARAPLITARNDYRLAIETLRQVAGYTSASRDPQSRPPEFVGTLDFTPVNFDLASAFGAAHANRPDLKRLEKLVDAGQENVKTARAGYLPTVSAFGGWALRRGSTNAFRDSPEGFLGGVQSQWNIFDGRATAGRVIQARSAVEQARLGLTETQLAVDVAVRRAYSQWQEATELAETSQKVVEQATEAVRLANARYAAGTSTQLDVLQAQVELTTARTNQIQAFYSYNVAVAALRTAMGLADEFVTR
ncbi:TolC family protein [Opitutus sp. ER46]|uniref:TolC family protein n=1 Tax=Opitutus sp. ER46 TaxID=2161864 RepID=UPI000D320777|nr:TolC family protein [Opitutus sp. ER46]PTX98999.1 TolC family protein [Opitutus sp. ER46]